HICACAAPPPWGALVDGQFDRSFKFRSPFHCETTTNLLQRNTRKNFFCRPTRRSFREHGASKLGCSVAFRVLRQRVTSARGAVLVQEQGCRETLVVHILVAHAPGEAARAELVAQKLDALGFAVSHAPDIDRAASPFARRELEARIDGAACVLV